MILMKEREVLGQNIRRHRQFKGLSPEELGKKVKLTKDTILRLERADKKFTKNIGLENLIKICRVLDVSLEELFIKNGDMLTLRFVISEHNIETLKKLMELINEIIKNKS